ncbi:hypothetical protein GCM10010973_07830 [Cribrihabitans marinus]|nr:hypothetical protein GCM10010973_07830 [Cribrihabitans marinus]
MLSGEAKAEITDWKTIGWWDISFYSGSEGCSAFAAYDGGFSFFIGLAGREDLYLEIFIANKDWRSIEEGKEYEVTAKFGNESPWNLEMTGSVDDDFRALRLYVPADSDDAGRFVQEFMRETKMRWTYEGADLGLYKLNGSRRAFKEVVACTKSYRDAVRSSSDPFSRSSTGSDPFE